MMQRIEKVDEARFKGWARALRRLCWIPLSVIVASVAACRQPAEDNDPRIRGLDRVPTVQVLKRLYPRDYASLRAAVLQARNIDEGNAALGKTLADVSNRQLPKAGPEQAYALFLVKRDEGRALQATNPAGCAAFMEGRGAPPGLDDFVTADLAARDRAASSQMLEQTATRPAAPAAPMPRREYAGVAIAALSRLPGADRDLALKMLRAQRAAKTPDEARAMCAYRIGLADQLLALPSAEAGARIRAVQAADQARLTH